MPIFSAPLDDGFEVAVALEDEDEADEADEAEEAELAEDAAEADEEEEEAELDEAEEEAAEAEETAEVAAAPVPVEVRTAVRRDPTLLTQVPATFPPTS